MGTLWGVLHCSTSPQGFFKVHIVQGGGPGHLCIHSPVGASNDAVGQLDQHKQVLYTSSMYLYCSSSAAFSVAIMPLLLQLLLHAAAVRHRVPDDKFCLCVSLHLIQYFLYLQHSNTN